jgi:hypothetical protein
LLCTCLQALREEAKLEKEKARAEREARLEAEKRAAALTVEADAAHDETQRALGSLLSSLSSLLLLFDVIIVLVLIDDVVTIVVCIDRCDCR